MIEDVSNVSKGIVLISHWSVQYNATSSVINNHKCNIW